MTLFEATTPTELAHFLQHSEAGQTVLYHVGFLPLDSTQSWRPKFGALPELQRAVWENRASLALTQKKLGPFIYEYRATRRA